MKKEAAEQSARRMDAIEFRPHVTYRATPFSDYGPQEWCVRRDSPQRKNIVVDV